MYTAIILNKESQAKLKEHAYAWFNEIKGWQLYCHHATLNMGSMDENINNKELLGKEAVIEIDAVGFNDYAAACRIVSMYTVDGEIINSVNKVPHVTMAVNVHEGGKPVMSNNIGLWIPVTPKTFRGKIKEIGS